MELISAFFEGRPTVYDLASYIIVVCLLIVVLSIHIRQMRHARKIKLLMQIIGVQTNIKE